MPMRIAICCALGLVTVAITGCSSTNPRLLRQSQLRAKQLYEQNRALNARNQDLLQQNAGLQQDLNVAQQRADNFASESAQLRDRYVSLLDQARNQPSPLSDNTTRRFQELAEKYPEFDFDPQTGVSKFHSDILFPSGSAELAKRGQQILNEFAAIMNDGDAQRLNILVVGHTDDKRIARGSTKAKHPTNWHLSTNRANSVVLELAKSGLQQERMGVAGYSMFQPLVPNTDEKARSQNRRVEIFVLAPDAVVAGWDTEESRN